LASQQSSRRTNLLEKNSFNATYNAFNQLLGYQYDASGNLESDRLMNTMTWDAESRLSTVGGATYPFDAQSTEREREVMSS
jgi:hypothetical protein